MDELLKDFLIETTESLDSVDLQLVQFEREPQNQAILRNVFRLVHSIKGTCGFLGLQRLETLTHSAETLMGRFRDGAVVTSEAVTVILAVIDRIKTILVTLETEAREPEGDDPDLIAAMKRLGEDAKKTQPIATPSTPSIDASAVESSVNFGANSPAGSPDADGEAIRPQIDPAGGNSIRVNLETLERLLNLVSELVLTRNQLLEMSRTRQDHALSAPLQRLSLVTAELQESVMQTRMQPVGHAWHKLPRLVRDLALELRKDIVVVMRGADTELDRQVLDLVKDPLTHLVRNAVDHGVEHPEDRIMAGKPARATIALNAFHAAGAITIEISDDGRGLDFERIRHKAIKQGLAAEIDAEKMTDAQLAKLIFHPGFSTAERVTSISGRGVGLDIVQTNVELIGGGIDVRSSPGRGVTFTLRLPLTLAIVPALLIAAAGQRFAIPQASVVELVRVGSEGDARVERVGATKMLQLRGQLLPLISLADTLKLEPPETASNLAVVLAAGSRRYALAVDTILHTEEIVVKPMATQLRQLTHYSGNTILGDGSVVLIIEPNGLARAAGVNDESERANRTISEVRDVQAKPESGLTLLLFRTQSGLTAVPISAVARLEDIELTRIENVGGKSVMQYKGRLMPVVSLAGVTETAQTLRPCLVVAWNDISVGIVVEEILDVVEEHVEIDQSIARPGVVGSTILGGRTVEVLDVVHYLAMAAPRLGQRANAATGGLRILLVEPSPFFRDILVQAAKSADYRVDLAETGAAAVALAGQATEWACILISSDLPDMKASELATRLRGARTGGFIRTILLTAASTDQPATAPNVHGFAATVSKFDREAVIAAISAKTGMREAA